MDNQVSIKHIDVHHCWHGKMIRVYFWVFIKASGATDNLNIKLVGMYTYHVKVYLIIKNDFLWMMEFTVNFSFLLFLQIVWMFIMSLFLQESPIDIIGMADNMAYYSGFTLFKT